MINPLSESIQYAALTKLIDLVESACTTNKRTKRDDEFNQAGAIYYLLSSLTFEDYIEDEQVNNILECLKQTGDLYDYPVNAMVNELDPPVINIGPQGPQGLQGERGEDGGATDFTLLNASTNGIADSFSYSQAYAARWDVLINGTAQRAGSVWATWLEDGSSVTFTPEIGTGDLNGSTSGIELTVTIFGSDVRLNAIISSGTWTITGSRYLIPNNGTGITAPSSLANGAIWIGNASNSPVANTITGDISISNTGVASITPLIIENGDVSATAAISVSKLAATTASRALVSDSSGFMTASSATATEVSYLSGVTSSIQTQLDSKLSAASGAISTVVSTNLTASRAVVSDPSGKIAVSGTTSTELGYVGGVTSAIQTQLNSKLNLSGGTLTGNLFTKSIQLDSNENLVLQGAGTISMGSGQVTTLGGGQFLGGIATESGQFIFTRVVAIGDWNMQFSASGSVAKTVAHGVGDYKKIRSVSVTIRDDADSTYIPLNVTDSTGVPYGGVNGYDGTNITLTQTNPNFLFNTTDYNATSYNRGWVTITYES